MNYKFAIPTYVSYCINESNLSIEDVKDLKSLQKKYNIDLQYVIDEYEYKIESENEMVREDDDYISLDKMEIFDSVIDDLWNEITDTFRSDVNLYQLDEDSVNKLYESISDYFNSNDWDTLFQTGIVKNIKMSGVDISNSLLIVEVEPTKELSESEIESIRKFLDYECSDGWGEEFENIDMSHVIDDDRTVFVKTWNPKSEVKYIR